VTDVGALPFGVPEILASVAGANRVLDAACGSGRLTVALASAGVETTGFDTNATVLEDARARAAKAGVSLTLLEADLNAPLPFSDDSFDGVTSRLALMIADDPVATLKELGRTLRSGGRLTTALWATLDRNPWFDEPRNAVRAVLGEDEGRFARAFGRLGDPDEASLTHASAGLIDVEVRVLEEHVMRTGADEHWRLLAAENGHFRRIDKTLDAAARAALVADLAGRLERFRDGAHLVIPRTLVLVTASA
jgi:SAM-dependent methyltransferase